MTELQRGKSRVIEKDHVIIIGFDENVTSIIEELVYTSENQKDAVLVIMADHDKTDMEDTIRDRVSDLGSPRSRAATQFSDKDELIVLAKNAA